MTMKHSDLPHRGLLYTFLTGMILLTGILCRADRPDDNRFKIVRMTPPNTLNEPMVFDIAPDGRVFIVERRGGIRMLIPGDQTVHPVGRLSVNNAARVGNGEQGLVGISLDPGFTENGWVYLYYYHPTDEKAVISRWEIRDNILVANSEIVMMEWSAQRETCCHTGGGMTWDKDRNLYITIGNNRGNNVRSHTDERPGREAWDDQGGAANTDSLEGKILRIHPEPDGTYTIPEGNLFPPGTPGTRPEIYTMGHRNAWRVSIDSKTGYIYWGEVGPDGREDTEIGPKGYDEFNQARGPGFFGWPYFVGESAFPVYDYAKDEPGDYLDPKRPVNRSPNNTGLEVLPPLQPSFVYYPYDTSDKFPAMGTGGRSATGGPVFRRADFPDAERPWPEFFEGKWLASELSRRAIFLIGMDEDSHFASLEKFLPDYRPVEPIDMKFGPDGDLYVLEYGGRWFQGSPEAKLTRIQYEAGNRKPIAVASVDRTSGKPPFDIHLSADESSDFDGDALTYEWTVTDPAGQNQTFNSATPTVSLDMPGAYIAWLTVTDPSGESDSSSLKVVSGNLPPEVSIQIKGNQSFYIPGAPLEYEVQVNDEEDGALSDGQIQPDTVSVSVNFANEGFDLNAFETLADDDEEASRNPVAFALMNKGNCKACHLTNGKLVGPGFMDVARKYQDRDDAMEFLTRKIVTGGAGSWGLVPMPPNYTINEAEASSIVRYILDLAGEGHAAMPVAGKVDTDAQARTGSYIIRAHYRDRGYNGVPALAGQAVTVLRPPQLDPASADESEKVNVSRFGANAKHGGYLKFADLDLTGIGSMELMAFALPFASQVGGTIEIRADGIDGPILGKADIKAPEPEPRNPPGQAANADDADAPRPRRRFNRPPQEPTIVKLDKVSGKHDLYLRFINPEAEEDASLMSVRSISLGM